MASLGARIAGSAPEGGIFYLQGTLGMGKTTLARSIIQGMGWSAHVKSPTYTLVESYPIAERIAYHFDLYRLADPEELEFMGIRDYDTVNAVWLVEWPERGFGILPKADVVITLQEDGLCRDIIINAESKKGQHIMDAIAQQQEAR